MENRVHEKRDEEEWDGGMFCATCIYGSLTKDKYGRYVVYCQEKKEYVPFDDVCGAYEF